MELNSMDEESAETHLGEELQTSRREDDPVKDVNSLQHLELDGAIQDQHDQNPESLKQDQEQQSLQSNLDHLQVLGKEGTRDEELKKCPSDPPEDQLEVLEVDLNPTEDADERGRASGDRHLSLHQDLLRYEQDQDPSPAVDLSRAQDQDGVEHLDHNDPDQDIDQDQDQDQNQDWDLTTAVANQEPAGDSGGGVPALVITQAEESCRSSAAPVVPELSPPEPSEPQRPQRPADLVTLLSPADPGLSSGSDGGDMSCSDLLSLRSDSFSLTSEPTVFRTSKEDDSRSVTASSVMSLFHRVQMDPLEKDWLRSSARGNVAAQRLLLSQEPSLVVKKVRLFVGRFGGAFQVPGGLSSRNPSMISGRTLRQDTALHWAAKQGHQEAVDMMLQSGADVNVRSLSERSVCPLEFTAGVNLPARRRRRSTNNGQRRLPAESRTTILLLQETENVHLYRDIVIYDGSFSEGYTALHLASIHGHQHIVHALINTYNAKTNVRDYHGKTPLHYWSGCTDVFSKPDAQSGLLCFPGRRTQRYALPSLLLSRSRSQGQLNLEFVTLPQSASHDALDLQV
ncbi:hypothetical protein L3Q82_023523 [Scortum barcoo]|uniref:Uncharacterized protein n=1 Tax=Scortum barcoo TaxID=214431 RepID=A0ACB8WTI6_9TELE|nr:hypothetical protein L3Q82_023523 [Scortum barcoo]